MIQPLVRSPILEHVRAHNRDEKERTWLLARGGGQVAVDDGWVDGRMLGIVTVCGSADLRGASAGEQWLTKWCRSRCCLGSNSAIGKRTQQHGLTGHTGCWFILPNGGSAHRKSRDWIPGKSHRGGGLARRAGAAAAGRWFADSCPQLAVSRTPSGAACGLWEGGTLKIWNREASLSTGESQAAVGSGWFRS